MAHDGKKLARFGQLMAGFESGGIIGFKCFQKVGL
jgi:hypothetical protein